MSTIISFAIQKGGVGKTTSSITTAAALAELKKHILLIDMDPQHNASLTLGKIDPNEQPRTVKDLFLDKTATFSTCSVPTKIKNVDLIPSNIDLFTLHDRLSNDPRGLMGLKLKLDDTAVNNYDFIIIDCPPTLGGPFLNNALCISDYYIMPVDSESKYALKGIQQFQEAVEAIQETINPKLSLLGVLITMFDGRTIISRAMEEAIRRFFGNNYVFKTIIHRNTAIGKAHLEDKTIISFDGRTPGAKNYRQFAKELLEWLDATKTQQ
jgi:chromosome partitioning protein